MLLGHFANSVVILRRVRGAKPAAGIIIPATELVLKFQWVFVPDSYNRRMVFIFSYPVLPEGTFDFKSYR